MNVVEIRFTQLLIENRADPDILPLLIRIYGEPSRPRDFHPYPYDLKGFGSELYIVGATVYGWAIDTLMHRLARQERDNDRLHRKLVEARIKGSLAPGREEEAERIVAAVLETVNKRGVGDAGTEKLIRLAAKAYDPAGYLTDTAGGT
jgi:hypothetical protein